MLARPRGVLFILPLNPDNSLLDPEQQRRHFVLVRIQPFGQLAFACLVGLALDGVVLLAARLGRQDRILQMFQRTVRYDLDSHTDATENGLHLRVMAGNWLTFTGGFCGMRVQEGMLSFRPFLPDNWEGYTVRLCWRACRIGINVSGDGVLLKHHHGPALQVKLFGEIYELAAGGEIRRPKDGTSTFLP